MSTARPVRIAVDIGGTFTDLQILDARHGRVVAWKTPTTPADPSEGLLTGVREAASRFGFALAEVGLLLHGTTIATNAVLERKLAQGVLLTTAGFEDVLEITRHVRRDIYGLAPDPFPCLIERDRRFGVPERLRADGSVETPLGDLAPLLDRLREVSPEAVAIGLLHAYANPAHERALREAVAAALPGVPISLSSEISPEIREYERLSTTVLNALLMPVVQRYLDKLESRLGEGGFAPRIFLVQSNGGMCSLRRAAEQPARLLLSGPSGGALAAERISQRLARPNLVAVDMGGTSFDVSVVQDHRIGLVTQGEVGGLPVRLPMVEMRTIGAGGGSIAAVDAAGRLTAGPRSAGARPGPVCYGRGGVEPTVTDANAVLGRFDPDFFLGGAMALDLGAARAAMEARIGGPLSLGTEEAAEGVLRVTNAQLAAAVRLSLFEKGLDPRAFSLLSFGGAGGLHATEVADELGITEVIFPREPGTLSAYGILFSDLAQDIARSRLYAADESQGAALAEAVDSLRAEATARLEADDVPAAQRAVEIAADLRYRGQAFELLVPWPEAPALAPLVARFHAAHRARFSYAAEGERVEIVTLRATAIGRLDKPAEVVPESPDAATKPGTRRIWQAGAATDWPVWRREALRVGDVLHGPAIIEEAFATHVIARHWQASLDPEGAIVARRMA
ncbi:hydantoinase/oxoprolinase family protein [Falsiroseomonas tokyonensis]|uniref:Hydantoinase/oxoprolinase family protein n=1 Tax=Falsiroseomonas tokyonensis TaxID=430521 RepID=A0ABV7BUJ9_9PROT|nr:hydantoinase/oxoprolinase family protein [Falsiroseomonas tokyonensis]MBU8538909.1 hydantoinase/oxoprolinase family protein [Falsiroseomonas tokyonensis]